MKIFEIFLVISRTFDIYKYIVSFMQKIMENIFLTQLNVSTCP